MAFALYQAGHIVVNGRYMFGETARAFPAPPAGWGDQTIEWARGMAITDFVNAVASVAFAVGFLRRKAWAVPLGLVTTAIYSAAAIMFTVSVVRTGSFAADPLFYVLLDLTGLPGVVLLITLFRDVCESPEGELVPALVSPNDDAQTLRGR